MNVDFCHGNTAHGLNGVFDCFLQVFRNSADLAAGFHDNADVNDGAVVVHVDEHRFGADFFNAVFVQVFDWETGCGQAVDAVDLVCSIFSDGCNNVLRDFQAAVWLVLFNINKSFLL